MTHGRNDRPTRPRIERLMVRFKETGSVCDHHYPRRVREDRDCCRFYKKLAFPGPQLWDLRLLKICGSSKQ